MLNLLPESQRRATEQTLVMLALQRFLAIIFLVATTVAIILLMSRLILVRQFEDLTLESTYIPTHRPTFLDEVKEVRQALSRLDTVQQNFRLTSPLVADIAQRTNAGVTLTRFHSEFANDIITIDGQAATREALLTLITALNTSSYIDRVTNPLSNLLTEKDIPFSLTGTLKANSLTLQVLPPK